MENETQTNELQITPQSKLFILEIAKWSKLFGILGFVAVGFLVLSGIFSTYLFDSLDESMGNLKTVTKLGGGFIMILYFIIAVIYYFPAKYLFDFSRKIKLAFQLTDQEEFDLAFEKLKSCFKFFGIYTVIILAIYAFVIILALALGLLGSLAG